MLKDKIFNQKMIQDFVSCGLDMKKYAALDWEGSLIDFLNEDRTFEGVDWWNNLWLVMQVMYPKYRRMLVKDALDATKIDRPIVVEAISLFGLENPEQTAFDNLAAKADLELKFLGEKDQQTDYEKILKAIRSAAHFNTTQGCPMALKGLIKIIGKDAVKELAVKVINQHP